MTIVYINTLTLSPSKMLTAGSVTHKCGNCGQTKTTEIPIAHDSDYKISEYCGHCGHVLCVSVSIHTKVADRLVMKEDDKL